MEEKKNKAGAYASLTGFRRAIPIILMALAIFTAMCFITKNTGALGAAISDMLLGLFSVGGFFIPVALAVHAIFYPSDVLKKRTVSRLIFTVITILTISTLTHTIAFIGEDMTFSASELYNSGMDIKGGGFVGGGLAFILTKVFGTVGVIIIAVALFAIYIAYYFSGSRSFLSKILLKILTAISNFFTGISDEKKNRKEKREKERAEKERERIAEQLAPLTDDEFFDADNGMKEMEIPELNIHEIRDESELERNPHLQEKVFHKSAADSYTVTSDIPKTSSESYTSSAPQGKKLNMEYSTVDSVHELANSVGETVFVPRTDDIIYDTPVSTTNADDVFSKEFEPFNLRMNAELSNKPSSKASKDSNSRDGITEFAEPINEVSAEDVEKARQRADFEMKKKAAIEAQKRYDAARQEMMRNQSIQKEAPAEPTAEVKENVSYSEPQQAPSAYTEPHSYNDEPTYTAPTADEPKNTSNTYAKTNSYNEEPTYTTPSAEEKKQAQSTYTEPRSYDEEPKQSYSESYGYSEPRTTDGDQIFATVERTTEPIERASAEFKDYGASAVYNTPTVEIKETQSDDVLRVTRTILEPSFSKDEDEKESVPQLEFDGDGGSRMEFDFDADEEDTEEVPVSEPEDEPVDEREPIPPEEQNPEVIRQREYFSFLNDAPDTDEDDENEGEEEFPETTVSQESYDSFNRPEEDDESEDSADSFYGSEIGRFNSNAVDSEESDDDEDDTPPFDFSAQRPTPTQQKTPQPEPVIEEKPDYSDYKYPPLDLLVKGKIEEDVNQEDEKNQNAEKLVDALSQFNVRISIKGIDRGPRITRYEIVPARGVKVNSVTNLFNDIALSLGVEGMRMEAPIPGKSAIGVEIPNKKPSTVLLRDLVESDEFICNPSKTLSCLGKDVTGNPVYADIAKMPHVLVAGATGMGKSVCINSILISILYKARPDEVKFIMIDPKKVEFNGYNGIPHLLVPVVTDVKQAAGALMWAVEQMEKRYDLMEALEVRKLDSYNEKVRENPELGEPLPKIIIVIDELNDIMLQVRKPAEDLIMSIAQKARAAGIHLIIGTQRPSVDVITGVIKANIPSRISCKVASYNDSKTILEQAGAEKLLNNGDMLYISAGAPKALRVQGAFVSDGEVTSIMKFLKTQAKGAIYDSQALEEINRAAQKCAKGKGGGDVDDDDEPGDNAGLFNDPKFIEAVEIAIKTRKVSTSLLQRKISIGYSKAAKYIDAMEDQGFVSEPNGSKPREILISMDEWHELLSRREL